MLQILTNINTCFGLKNKIKLVAIGEAAKGIHSLSRSVRSGYCSPNELALKTTGLETYEDIVERGQLKKEVQEAKLIENFGIENDGHAGDWNRR